MRHKDQATTDEMVAKAYVALAEAAKVAQVDYEIESEWSFGTEVFDPDCIDLVCSVARDHGIEPLLMRSQAGYDACNMCAVAPTALIFCPCIDGITHNECEDVEHEPTVQAVAVLLHSVLARANR